MKMLTQKNTETVPLYYVIFRACDAVNAASGAQRPGGIHKTQLVKACFNSLQRAIADYPHRIVVLGDKLSTELTAFFNDRKIEVIAGRYGNDESIRQSLKLALKAPEGSWVYFCEDDYLHSPNAFVVMDNLIRGRSHYLANSARNIWSFMEPANSRHLVIFPSDYPDRYLPQQRHPGLLYVADKCHWRQVRNITFTFMAQPETVKKYAWAIRLSAWHARDGLLSRILFQGFLPGRSALCLSPIPGVAAHMHEGVMGPIVNWTQLLDENLHSVNEIRSVKT